jgi:CRISPR/Cas system Type II protein with McrA/HNH and RuvC-like nuclease domain
VISESYHGLWYDLADAHEWVWVRACTSALSSAPERRVDDSQRRLVPRAAIRISFAERLGSSRRERKNPV